MVRAQAAELDMRRQDRTRLTLQAARRGIEALADLHGRKSLLLLSEGFLQDGSKEAREVAASAREANAAVYFVDVRGLEVFPGGGTAADSEPTTDPRTRSAMRFEESVFESAGAEALAAETGGFSVRNTNDLPGGFERIAQESRVFYLLGYYPPEGKSDRKWRKLKVEVTRPGLTVRARRGYTLRREAADPKATRQDKKKEQKERTIDPGVARAIDSALDPSDIPLRAMTYVLEPRPKDTAHVVVAVELDASRLAFQPKGQLARRARGRERRGDGRDSGRGFRHDDTFELSEEGEKAPGWRALVREFELPSGVTQARVVVRDEASGALGAVSQRFEVLPAGTLRLSTPVLTDHVLPPQKAGGRPVPALAAHRVFRPGATLYCEFEVFGATPSPEGTPRVRGGPRGARRRWPPHPQGRPHPDRRRSERTGGPARGGGPRGHGAGLLRPGAGDPGRGERRPTCGAVSRSSSRWRPSRASRPPASEGHGRARPVLEGPPAPAQLPGLARLPARVDRRTASETVPVKRSAAGSSRRTRSGRSHSAYQGRTFGASSSEATTTAVAAATGSVRRQARTRARASVRRAPGAHRGRVRAEEGARAARRASR